MPVRRETLPERQRCEKPSGQRSTAAKPAASAKEQTGQCLECGQMLDNPETHQRQ